MSTSPGLKPIGTLRAPAVPRHHGAEPRGLMSVRHDCYQPAGRTDRFGRMFPNLPARPAAAAPTPAELGVAGGPMDGGAAETPLGKVGAGFTFLGQFLDHDITLDTTSSLDRQNDPEALRNFRTPSFELDSVYGMGPDASPYLYAAKKPGHLLLDQNHEFDLPRNSEGVALIGDPRNDENLIIAQLHLGFLKFHNALMAQTGHFHEAQQLVRWHYQWIIVEEFLPLICGEAMVKDVFKNGRRFYHPWNRSPYIPVEFSVAAYRFGHSMARFNYKMNAATAELPLFDAQAPPSPPENRADLRGGPIVEQHAAEWPLFFDLNQSEQKSNRIDSKLAGGLFDLPFIPEPEPERRSLAFRNLLRSEVLGLPSGQAVSSYMSVEPLADDKLWDNPAWHGQPAPLWYYILREAEVQNSGKHLGAVGGRVVAEVFHGLLTCDPSSYVSVNPIWKPTLGSNGKFGITDLLKIAGVA